MIVGMVFTSVGNKKDNKRNICNLYLIILGVTKNLNLTT